MAEERLNVHSYLFQGFLHVIDPCAGFQVARREMALAFQASGHVDPVDPFFEGSQKMGDIHTPRAGYLYYFDIAGISASHGT
jgi:hypothetical protein